MVVKEDGGFVRWGGRERRKEKRFDEIEGKEILFFFFKSIFLSIHCHVMDGIRGCMTLVCVCIFFR